MNESKPPIGLMPQSVWVDLRIKDITDAMKRYLDAGKYIPVEWADELADLIRENHK